MEQSVLYQLNVSPRAATGRGRAPKSAPLERFGAVTTRSPAMGELLRGARRASRSRAALLISGETGTGKELTARAVHAGGERRRGPFVAVNCAALPDALLESELFGHLRGAFTGAERDKRGLFEAAHGGTLFLDEIGETSPALQAALLRALQEREIRPVGATRSRRVDVRVIAATNRDLGREVEAGAFRRDLYYRLAVFVLDLPPLRRRREDIPELAELFVRRAADREGRSECRLASEVVELLLAYSWPGNIRELENEVERALTWLEGEDLVRPEHCSPRLRGAFEPFVAAAGSAGETLSEAVDRFESWLLRTTLARCDGKRTATATRLGLSREGLYKKMKRLGIR